MTGGAAIPCALAASIVVAPAPARRAARVWALLFCALCVAAAGCRRPSKKAEPLKVAAAADLGRAFEDLGRGFEKATGEGVAFTFGSTGLLSQQIEQGAPFDVFAAANVSYVDGLIQKGYAAPETRALYARGRIVIWWPKGSLAAPPAALGDLRDARFVRVAIANPEHAPYGQAAEQALTRAGLREALGPRLVYGENVQQAMQFAATGNAEVALIALSLAVGSAGDYVVIDQALHDPIDQALAVCARAPHPALGRAFVAYVTGAEGRATMRRHGFLLPGEGPAEASP